MLRLSRLALTCQLIKTWSGKTRLCKNSSWGVLVKSLFVVSSDRRKLRMELTNAGEHRNIRILSPSFCWRNEMIRLSKRKIMSGFVCLILATVSKIGAYPDCTANSMIGGRGYRGSAPFSLLFPLPPPPTACDVRRCLRGWRSMSGEPLAWSGSKGIFLLTCRRTYCLWDFQALQRRSSIIVRES